MATKKKAGRVLADEGVQVGVATPLAIVDDEPQVPAVQGETAVAVDPGALLALAVKQKLPMETIERLLAMRRELKAEWAKERYFAALASFQLECPAIERTRVVKNSNGTERYRYAAIEDILRQVGPVLERHGFSYTAKTEQGEASVTVTTEAHHRDGHAEMTTIKMPIDPAPGMNKSQATVSAFSYARRVSFCGAFGIMTEEEDDDGEKAGAEIGGSEEKPKVPPRASEQTAQPKGTAEMQRDRKLPDDPVFKSMLTIGTETYWMLRDAYDSKIASKAYCEKQGARIRMNAKNAEFLEAIRDEVKADLAKFAGAKELATGGKA